MMRVLLVTVLLAACGGVSEDPPSGWDDALVAFATAHCEWNDNCDGRNEPTCVDSTIGIMTTSRAEVPAGQEDACIDCLEAWTAAYAAATSPCTHDLTFEQSQAVAAACMTIDCVELHDLPGSNPN